MNIDDIKIFPFFSDPNPDKLKEKEREYLHSGMTDSNIIVDAQGNLIDGYCWYLLAKSYGLNDIPVRRYSGRREIVKAYHKKGGHLYFWELPGSLIGRIKAGDKLIVDTLRGYRTVKVVSVEEYDVKEHGTLKTAIRKPRKKRPDDTEFVLCPVCGCKSRQKVRRDTVARRLPVFCSKCNQTTVVNLSTGYHVEVV